MKLNTLIFSFVLAALCSSLSLDAQIISVQGRLTDEKDGFPIEGAYVFFDMENWSLTDNNGRFQVSTSDCATCTLSVEFLGYEAIQIPFILNKDSTIKDLQLELVQKNTKLKEISVIGGQMPYKGSVEGTNYYISPKLMKTIQPLSTEEVLRALPGVNIVGDMGLSNRPNISIRGSWGRRSEKVLVMEDGSPVSPAPYIAPGIYYNPISDRLDAIEVYTGADILRYGPNNMYGIINYITPKPPQRTTTRAKIVGGQRGFFTGLLSYGGTWNKLGMMVEGVYKRFDGFVDNSAVEMINLNAKIFAELSEAQSLYFKVSGQFEVNQASLSAITPLTFRLDPTQNPFDADRFTMHRYGIDIIHKWAPDATFEISSKLFASDFARDWWRQVNAIIPAALARDYLGEQIFMDRFRYLDGQQFGDEDVVRVGRITQGRESTTDSRWHFTVAGIEESLKKQFRSVRGTEHNLELNYKLHYETYTDMVLAADSSRWARSGRFTRDIAYNLFSNSGFVRYQLRTGNLSFTPILRIEHVGMYKFDRLDAAMNPGTNDERENEQVNRYTVFLPGATLAYQTGAIKWYASVYQGYIAPSKNFAFLVERDGQITTPEFGEVINMAPELNVNMELGARGAFIPERIEGQMAIFQNNIRNFYLGGWNEFFDQLGRIRVRGLEASLVFDLLGSNQSTTRLFVQPNITMLHSRVLSGEVFDRHLWDQVVHSRATKEEFVQKVNSNPGAYRLYTRGPDGQEILFTGTVEPDLLDDITRTVFIFGENAIENAETPYTPRFSSYLHLGYQYKGFTAGLTYNYMGAQYTEFANFENESADGAIGRLDGFSTWDMNINYDFFWKNIPVSIFLIGKNVTNDIVRISRLNRANSGIFPGGFRQINLGLNIRI